MKTPQIIYIVLSSISLLISAYEHGKPKKGNHNIFSTLFAYIIVYSLLIAGGFFK